MIETAIRAACYIVVSTSFWYEVNDKPHRQLVQQDRSGGRAGDELLRLGVGRKQQRPHKFWSEADYYIESVGRAVGASLENGMGGGGII